MFSLYANKRDAFTVYLIMEGGASLFYTLVFTVNMVYQATVVGLSPLQLVLVGTTLEATAFIFEIPTGIVADVYSRRLSVIIGLFLIGAGFALEGSVARFEAVLLAQMLWGLGYTFTSGATQAWIADEVGEERAGQAFVRGAQFGQIGALVGIPLSVGLATLTIRLPLVLGGISFMALGMFLILVMPETGFAPTPAQDRSTWGTMAQTFRDGLRLVRGRPVLVMMILISAIYGLYSEGFDRLWTPHFLDNFTFPGSVEPVVWFGVISATSTLLALIGTEIVRRRLDLTDQRRMAQLLLTTNTMLVFTLLAFALAEKFTMALAAYLTFVTLRRLGGPILDAWINPHIDSQVRATVFSMTSQVNAIGQIAGGPVVGLIGTWWSLRAALVTSALILSPVLAIYARAQRLAGISRPDVPAVKPVAAE